MISQTKQTGLACHACRSRKVRCSRDFHGCHNCRKCGDTCIYPPAALKPGPKRGSVHRRRRHDRLDPAAESSLLPGTAQIENSGDRLLSASTTSNRPRGVSEDEQEAYSEHIQEVAELCHPSNEFSSPQRQISRHEMPDQHGDVLSAACRDLGISRDFMEQMIAVFFQTFTTFSLFRAPYFITKLNQIVSVVQVRALLAAVFAFACKGLIRSQTVQNEPRLSTTDYAELAINYAEEALNQCGDEAPPLCVLQALILTTHWLIIKGVRGKAWRYVGICTRLLFELGIHATDANVEFDGEYLADPEKWCRDEEGRRAYWAVWEMDQYASHIKRLPITSDWTRDGVHLPAEDEKWLAGRPQRSCALARDLIDRCKNLQATGSKSTRAWYIVIASLNAVAHDIVYSRNHARRLAREQVRVIAHQWPELFNIIQLSMIVLPEELQFHGQHLDFGTQTMGLPPVAATLHRHSAIYEIALMPEVSKVIALRPYVFDIYMRKLLQRAQGTGDTFQAANGLPDEMTRKAEQCFQSADRILNLIVSCNESHYRYVNPYVTQVSWLGATVQLLQLQLTGDESKKKVIRSKFEIFKATNEKFMQHWNMSRIPKENLETLESRLNQFTAASQRLMLRETMMADHANDPPQQARSSPSAQSYTESSINGISQCTSTFSNEISQTLNRFTSNSVALNDGGHPYLSLQMETREERGSAASGFLFTQQPQQRVQSVEGSGFADTPPYLREPPKSSSNSPTFPQNININPLSENRNQIPQHPSLDSEPMDWLSIFPVTEIDADLTDYLEIFLGHHMSGGNPY
ncbi:hypothetical protein LTR84_007255 [Exophiala bonariae]|uniref:Zn(2)-C6 fungal-type domain-containing protein n=1 Tax=Exophiala bonariae TaxID=1690606 RepID=A0AAV9MZA7_9EURO|nr:hypothetical protein LTR84_007255 [Exophiala bonariae]